MKFVFLKSLIKIVSIERFIANRITQGIRNKSTISKPIVKIGIIAVALGMAVMLLTICIMLGFKREIQNKLTGLNAAITISSTTINSSQEQNPIVMTKDSLLQLSQLKEISHLQGIAYKNGIIKTEDENEGIVLKGVDTNYDFNFIRKNLVQGQLLRYSDTITLPEIVVSKALADAMHFELNKKLLVYFVVQRQALDTVTGSFYTKFEQRSRRFKITGIFNTGFSDFDKNLAFIDIGVIRKLNYWTEQQVGAYEIAIQNFKNLEEVETRVEDNVGYNYRVETIVDQQVALFGWLDMIDVNGIIIITLMIIVAGINMITALLILILERTNMVGLVKSLGMSNASVRGIFLNIALQLLGKGMLWGNIVGLGLCTFQYFTHAIKLDSTTYYIGYVAIEFNWMYIIGINVLTFVVSLLLLLLPTLLVTRLTPIKTLRFS
jgi:lipoprotein-releasing system permease protein